MIRVDGGFEEYLRAFSLNDMSFSRYHGAAL